jgi:hypothetical protein
MGPGTSPGIEKSVTKGSFAEAGRSLEMLLGVCPNIAFGR